MHRGDLVCLWPAECPFAQSEEIVAIQLHVHTTVMQQLRHQLGELDPPLAMLCS